MKRFTKIETRCLLTNFVKNQKDAENVGRKKYTSYLGKLIEVTIATSAAVAGGPVGAGAGKGAGKISGSVITGNSKKIFK